MAKDQRGHFPDWNEAMGRAAVRLLNLEASLPPDKWSRQAATEHLRIVEMWIAFAREAREGQAQFQAQPPDQAPIQNWGQPPVPGQPPIQNWGQPVQDQAPIQDWGQPVQDQVPVQNWGQQPVQDHPPTQDWLEQK